MSRRACRILCGLVFLLAALWRPLGGVVAQKAAPRSGSEKTLAADPFAGKVRPLLNQYCTKCHGGARPKGSLDLDKFKNGAAAIERPEIWAKVAENLRSGDMPPKGKPRPTLDEIKTITTWADEVLAQADCTKQKNPGRVTIRRLNRVEYKNTIRDLFGIDFKPADDFPADDVGYGFDNIGDVLTLSPLLMERYLDAADKIVEQAFKDPKLRQRIMLKPADKKQRRQDRARDVIKNFGPRVYRRPVTAEEIDRFGQLVELAFQSGQRLDEGIQLVVKAMLVSPHFLFRIELDRSTDANAVYAISEHELASRLSYFLWSSMPDDELFKLAGAGSLRKNLEVQVRRMLKDGKVRALTENFAGQWLNLRILKEAAPDPKNFPTFNENLRTAMRTETEMFFDAVVKEDRSIMDFLDADFTFVNEALAKHYGISGVKGKEFQRVRLTGDQRGGVITQASILTVTSNPTRTAPVKRGKWILENILNTPPPPPPPDAGELPEGDGAELKGTLRQRLEMHRSKAICASCHQRMDPLGFALENFDAIGAWRTRDGKFPIDNTGTLPTGQSFVGPKGLRTILKSKEADFRKCLTEKLLTYALGRGLEFYDKCAVDDVCKALAGSQNRISAMVVAIVKSDPFQLRKGRGTGKP
jgi:hypothetical protein